MKEQVKGILFDFKDAGWSVQKVEKKLLFANGSLGKVVNGMAGISDYRFSKLLELHQKEIKKQPTVTKELSEQIAENNKPEVKAVILAKRDTPIAKSVRWSNPIENKDAIPRLEGENSLDYRIRCSDLNKK